MFSKAIERITTMIQRITAKLGNMRKAQDWVVYPPVAGRNGITIQSDKRIACFDPENGKGLLSDGKGGHQGFHKLMPFAGAITVIVPPGVVQAALAAQPKSGDVIGSIGSGGVVRIA
jgi:hypothetical protein